MNYQDAVIDSIIKTHHTPILYIDTNIIKQKYEEIHNIYPELNLLYQIKQNSNFHVLNIISKLNIGFDIQSYNELKYIINIKQTDNNLSLGNTIKSESTLKLQKHYNIIQYVVDTKEELLKINKIVKNQNIWYRLNVVNQHSLFKMDTKFGQNVDEIKELLMLSKKLSINPYGISFHVGSQTTDIDAWINQLKDIKEIFDFQNKHDIKLKQINIGGGFPVKYNKPVISLSNILYNIKDYIQNNFDKNIKIYAEPGRYLTQEQGVIISKVLLSGKRNNKNWIYLDAGIYQGLSEILSGIKYDMIKYKQKNENVTINYNIGGPSCDGMDILQINKKYNYEIKTGDYMLIKNTGSYTYDTNTHFNGLNSLTTIVI